MYFVFYVVGVFVYLVKLVSMGVCLFQCEPGKESRVEINGLLALSAYHNVSISQIYAAQISL